ncbi:MBL fold metallo-hydrolase [Sunxiuqinia sp. A32]|uniref:MBL fold metallo-hydrolase n=1 Tax=Sunxiuqinia sp. A32 TaxID=3461496 RepID=UPI004045BC99
MKRIGLLRAMSIALTFFVIVAGKDINGLVIETETSLTYQTNCYLLYDIESNEAALVDVSEKVDSLIQLISDKDIQLKYIFITHCHPDHVYGLASIRKKFPEAKVCFSKEEYDAMLHVYSNWKETYSKSAVKILKSEVELYRIADMDFTEIGEPDIWIQENDSLYIGNTLIKTLLVPGHAPGSICYYTDKIAFTGDELFYRGVGNTQKYPNSSFPKQIESVRKLYKFLDENTIAYPGHGPQTIIGEEKVENPYISEKDAIQ